MHDSLYCFILTLTDKTTSKPNNRECDIMDKQKIAEDINRAELAHQVTQNPVYIQAMQMIQAKAFNDFTDSKADDVDIRQQAWLQMKSNKEFQTVLEHIMANGSVATDAKKKAKALDNFGDEDLY